MAAKNYLDSDDMVAAMGNYSTEQARKAQNTAGGFVVWEKPRGGNRRYFAFHPIMFVAKHYFFATSDRPAPTGAQTYTSGGKTVYNSINEAVEVSLPLYDEDGALVTTLRATTMQGEARFDVSTIVRTWFSDVMQDNDNGLYGTADEMLSIIFNVRIDDRDNTTTKYVVQNAVSQVGSDGEKDFTGNVFGQDNKHIVLWSSDDDSYPTISVLLFNGKTIGGEAYGADHTYQFPVTSQSVWNTLNTALGLTAAGFTLEDERGLESCGANCVRWLNRKGAIEYFVFRRGMSKQKTASTKTMREVYAEDYADIRTNRQATEVDGKRSITLRADGLTYDELDFLTKLPYSPHIQWFDPDNDMWVGVTVEQFDNTEVTKLRTLRNSGVLRNTDNLYSFEITLQCPAINMQF